MILDRLEAADRYVCLHAGFAKAFAFLRRADLTKLAPGRHEIDGDRVYAMVIQAPGRGRDAARLEAHRRYIDVQYAAAGIDEIGWKSRSTCRQRHSDYDADKDVEFFADTPEAWLALHPGSFAVFFPEDPHAPMIAEGNLHKVVVKVAV